MDCSLIPPKDATLPNFLEKNFVNSHKTAKFMKIFSLESFLLYGMFSYLALIGHITSGLQLGMKEPVHWLIRE